MLAATVLLKCLTISDGLNAILKAVSSGIFKKYGVEKRQAIDNCWL